MAETMNEEYLERYLEDYARGSDETEKRYPVHHCAICGDRFGDGGKEFYLSRFSGIRINGKKMKKLYICDSCYENAEEIESEG